MSRPRALLTPSSVASDETVELTVSGIPTEFSGRLAEVVVVGIDHIETFWVTSVTGVVSEEGAVVGELKPSLVDETVLETVAIRLMPNENARGESWELSGDSVGRCVVVDEDDDWTADALAKRAEELRAVQEARYTQPIGDPAALEAREHRVLCVIERLRSTVELKLPGARVLPLTVGNTGAGEPPLVDEIVGDLGWPIRVDPRWWAQHSAAARPWTAIVVEPVYAADFNAAAELAWRVRDRISDGLALTRGSSPRPVITVVEQRQLPNGVKWRYYFEDGRYGGNLMGGFIAGESQRELVMADAAMDADPLLALCVRLFREAQREVDPDAAYFRYWSLLETLSAGRFGEPHQVVGRLDGTSWPGNRNTTGYAAPRVYALISKHLAGINETSQVTPAADLYEGVRAWYGRRNATGHYGRFNDADSAQRAQPWFKWAVKTQTPAHSGFGSWLWVLQNITSFVLRRELASIGRPAIRPVGLQ